MKNLRIYFLVFVLVFSLAYLPSCKTANDASPTPDPRASFTLTLAVAPAYSWENGIIVGVAYASTATLTETAGVGATIQKVDTIWTDNFLNTASTVVSGYSYFGANYIPGHNFLTNLYVEYIPGSTLLEAVTCQITVTLLDDNSHTITKSVIANVSW